MPRALLRLVALLVCVDLAAGRLGMLVHELLGHASVAVITGASIESVHLHWFGGGFVRTGPMPLMDNMAMLAAGVLAQSAVAILVWFSARGHSIGAQLLRVAAALQWLSAGRYFASASWEGYGDGFLVYLYSGDARWPFAIIIGLATCLVAFYAARTVTGTLAATLPGGPLARFAGTLTAAVLAVAIPRGLAVIENSVRPDEHWAASLTPGSEEFVAGELALWEAQRPHATPAERAAEVHALTTREPFPFGIVVDLAVVAAIVAGGVRSRRQPHAPIESRLLARAAIAMVASCIAVIVISQLVPS